MKLKFVFVAAALLASFGAHATTERTQPDGRVLDGIRKNGLHLNGLRMQNTATHNGLGVNGLHLNNGISANGLRLNNGIGINGLRMTNGLGINGMRMKNSEHLGDAVPTGLASSAGPALMPQVVGIVFDNTGARR